MDININAMIGLSQKFGKRMSLYRTHGRIINFSSSKIFMTKIKDVR